MKLWISMLSFALILLPITTTYSFDIHPFDSKRLVQILVVICGLLTLAGTRQVEIPRKLLALTYGALSLLLISSFLAYSPLMALLESANILAVALCCYLVARHTKPLSTIAIRVLAIAAGCYSVVALSHLVSAIILNTPEGVVGRLPGFANIRFFGHWLTWSLPIIGALPLFAKHLKSTPKYWLWILAITWWALFYIAAGRGSALGLAAASIAIWITTGRAALPWIKTFLTTATAGTMLGYAWMTYEAQFFSSALHADGGLLSTTTSDRLALWKEAWEMFLDSPVWGVGPMHFSHLTTAPVAHPHNLVMIMLAETGLLFCFMLFGSLAYLLIQLKKRLQNKATLSIEKIAFSCACLAAGLHSLVSSVHSAPYSQLWLILIIGCTIQQFLHPKNIDPRVPLESNSSHLKMLALSVACILALGVLLTVLSPNLPDPWADITGRHAPRFWSHGYF